MIVQLASNASSTKDRVEAIFGHLVEDVKNPTRAELSACKDYAQSKGWEMWAEAFGNWEAMGEIPFEDEE